MNFCKISRRAVKVIQVSEMGVKKPVMLAVYDGLILLFVTGFGLIFFRREDLK